jgi:CRP-like cAMP-binding protein
MGNEGLAAAFTPGGLLGQLAFLLLLGGIIASNLDRMRALVACAALAGLLHAVLWSGSAITAFWWGLLLLASLLLLAIRVYQNKKVRFTAEEERALSGPLKTLPRSRARHFFDQGFWLSGREGDTLTREEEAVSHLFYLSEGEARVMSHGHQVGMCRPGDLIGEGTVLTGERASATVVLNGPARFWCAPTTVLLPYLAAHDDVRRALEQGFTMSLRSKLRQSNERMAEAGGLQSEASAPA